MKNLEAVSSGVEIEVKQLPNSKLYLVDMRNKAGGHQSFTITCHDLQNLAETAQEALKS